MAFVTLKLKSKREREMIMIIVKENLSKRVAEALSLIKASDYEKAQTFLEKLKKDSEANIIHVNELLDFSEKTVKEASMMIKFVEEKIELGIDDLSIEQQLKQLDPRIDVTIDPDEPRVSLFATLKESFKGSFGKKRHKKTDDDEYYDVGGENE